MSWTHGVGSPTKNPSKITGHYFDVDNTDFLRSDVSTKAAVQGLAIQTNGRMYIVDSGASLHMLGISSLSPREKRTPRKSQHVLGIQATDGITFSTLQQEVIFKTLAPFGCRFSVSPIAWAALQRFLFFLFVAVRRHSHTVPRNKGSLYVASKTSSLWLQ